MGNGRWVGGTFVFVTEEKADRLAANTASSGDIVFTQRGTVGQVALVPDTFPRFLVSQSQMKLTPNPRVADVRYLYYWFSAPRQVEHMKGRSIQTGVPHTNLGILGDSPVTLPPLSIQRRIASVLGALDDKIELNRKMSQTLDAMLMIEFRQRFSSALETSPQSALPAGWSSATVGDVVEVRGGTTPPTKNRQYWENGTHYFCTPKDMSQLGSPVLLATERRVTDAGLAKTGSGLLPKGTVPMSSRAPIGYVAIALDADSTDPGHLFQLMPDTVPRDAGRAEPSDALSCQSDVVSGIRSTYGRVSGLVCASILLSTRS
jgi:type I restriction enzyme S subunit